MSVDTDFARADDDGGSVGLDLVLTGALVARAGARRGRVVVSSGSTVADAIDAWADAHGTHIRYALLEGDRLRSSVRARRVAGETAGVLVASEPVRNGDTIRFEFRE